VLSEQGYDAATIKAIAREAGLNDSLQRTLQHPESYRLKYELFSLGLRNPALKPAVRALLASGRSGISNVVRAAAVTRSLDADTLAAILLACFDGLALQRLTEPDFDIESAYRLISRMVNTLLEPE